MLLLHDSVVMSMYMYTDIDVDLSHSTCDKYTELAREIW